jgi:hypothetical protein
MTVRLIPTARALPLTVAQTRTAGDAGSADASAAEYSTPHTSAPEVPPASPCLHCHQAGPHTTGPGAGPPYAHLGCGRCGRFLRWLPQPRPVAQEGRS